jgi:hypothetical protein
MHACCQVGPGIDTDSSVECWSVQRRAAASAASGAAVHACAAQSACRNKSNLWPAPIWPTAARVAQALVVKLETPPTQQKPQAPQAPRVTLAPRLATTLKLAQAERMVTIVPLLQYRSQWDCSCLRSLHSCCSGANAAAATRTPGRWTHLPKARRHRWCAMPLCYAIVCMHAHSRRLRRCAEPTHACSSTLPLCAGVRGPHRCRRWPGTVCLCATIAG